MKLKKAFFLPLLSTILLFTQASSLKAESDRPLKFGDVSILLRGSSGNDVLIQNNTNQALNLDDFRFLLNGSEKLQLPSLPDSVLYPNETLGLENLSSLLAQVPSLSVPQNAPFSLGLLSDEGTMLFSKNVSPTALLQTQPLSSFVEPNLSLLNFKQTQEDLKSTSVRYLERQNEVLHQQAKEFQKKTNIDVLQTKVSTKPTEHKDRKQAIRSSCREDTGCLLDFKSQTTSLSIKNPLLNENTLQNSVAVQTLSISNSVGSTQTMDMKTTVGQSSTTLSATSLNSPGIMNFTLPIENIPSIQLKPVPVELVQDPRGKEMLKTIQDSVKEIVNEKGENVKTITKTYAYQYTYSYELKS